MTSETRRRIEAYKKALPEMRERVLAVAILLVMSISMMTSATFAWLTISRNPEVTGVSTTVAANGNLEIALATGTTTSAKAPGDSQVGDSSATKGQSIAKANLTWGNLVNLSDPSYGLDNLTLRPAQLNQFSLLTSPLYGAVYQGDGRVEKLNSSFGYATWNAEKERFMIKDNLGVRAISSVKVEAIGFAQQVLDKRDAAEKANLGAGTLYYAIIENSDYMDTLATVMGTYMTAILNEDDASLSNPNIDQEDVINLRDLFKDFIAVYDAQFSAITELVNYQLFLLNNSETGNTPYTEKTVQDIMGTTEAALKNEKIQVSGLTTAKNDYNNLKEGYETLKELAEQGSVKWADSGLIDIVDSLMNTAKCTLDGTPIGSIGMSNAFGYLDGKTHTAKITNGVLYNFEQLNGARFSVEGLSVSAKKIITVSIKANISTTADSALFVSDLEKADKLNQGSQGEKVARDTYGLAVDLWVRTNASNSYLTLEGNVLTKSETVRDTGKDMNGNEVELFTLTRTVEEEAETVIYDLTLYQLVSKDESNNEVTTWHNATNHATVELEENEEPLPKMKELITVIGYEGENRVWEDASQLSLDATTQGSGSCYVYYADSPEDQARSLKLLESMNVAFVDEDGLLMATAVMDTQRFYAENGRVTVPLVLGDDSLEIGTDSEGDPIYAITSLVQNEPKRITAIVYLDGMKLNNQDVLAASDIQGKLNIQFGSSVTLSHSEDETLRNATRSVSADIDKNSFKYDEAIESGKPMTTKVTLHIDGDEPAEVTAFFIRAISSTQGSREKEIAFVRQADGTWTADYTFTSPGNYILRSVELDGQTYDLAECPTVTVEGFTVNSLECVQAVGRHASIMTAAGSGSVDLKLRFASDKVEAMPTTVQGRFLRNSDGTAVNINFTYNAGGANKGYWTGQATFISSGEYTLEYLVLDGEYAQLEDSMVQTATVYLGMKTAVYTDSPVEFKYDPPKLTDMQKNLYMKVKIMDNTGAEMEGLQNVHLYYLMEGSTLPENGFNAPLIWDGSIGYYTCSFPSKVGVFKFSHVTVGSNTITYAETSPKFRVISPEPPSYVGFVKKPYVYNPDGDTTMDVQLSYSSTATVAAVIKNLGDGKIYEVQGTKGTDENNVQTWKFLIPATDDKQDGNWQLEAVKIWNYYDTDGNYIKAEIDDNGDLIEDGERDDPMVYSVNGHITKAVTTLSVKVNLPENYDAHLGNSATTGSNVTIDTATAAFLDSQEVSVPTVTIVDFEGAPVGTTNENGDFTSYISNVKFVYNYGGQSQAYGGYTSEAVVKTDGVLTVNLTSSDNMRYEQSGTASVQYAGVYTPKLQYTVNGVTYTKDASDMGATAPTFYAWSKKPTAKITGVSPTSQINTKLTWTTNRIGTPTFTASESRTNSRTDYTATLYASATVDNGGSMGLGNRHGFFAEPKLTLTVYDVPNGITATLKLPAGSASEVVFERAGNGSIEKEIGRVSTVKSFGVGSRHYLEGYTGHGNVSITTMTLSKDGVTYTVTLDNSLEITNPSSEDKLS